MDVLHAAIEVEDLDVMRDFYKSLLGLDHSRDFETSHMHNYYVKGAGSAEIQFRVVDSQGPPTGIHHIAIAVNDVDEVVEQAIEEWDCDVEMEPRRLDRVDQRIAFIVDPEGYIVQLVEDLEVSPQ